MATKKTEASKTTKTTKKATKKKPVTKKAVATKAAVQETAPKAPQVLRLIRNDKYLAEYANAINGRHQSAIDKIAELTQGGAQTLSEFASGYLYFGLHKVDGSWILREWAPNATAIYLIGDFTGWKEDGHYAFKRIKDTGNWELVLPEKALKHGDLYKLSMHWEGGQGERIPAWVRRVVQDETTKIFLCILLL